MTRRFQFSLKTLLVVTTVAAVIAAMHQPSATTVITFAELAIARNPKNGRLASTTPPARIARLAGKPVKIEGYVLPGLYRNADSDFVLVGDLLKNSLHWGPDELVVVELSGGVHVTDIWNLDKANTKMYAEGVFFIERRPLDNEYPFRIYLREATSGRWRSPTPKS